MAANPPLSKVDQDFLAFKVFFEEFKNESDRAAVILGAAKLDLLLYQMLQKLLKPSTSKADELMDGDSPLGTFSAKISIAHRLNLIDDEFCRVLNLIRRIRNSFAHELSGISLESGGHRDRIKELMHSLGDNEGFGWLLERFFDKDQSPKHQFRCAVGLACVRLEGAYEHSPRIDWTPMTLTPPKFATVRKRTPVSQPNDASKAPTAPPNRKSAPVAKAKRTRAGDRQS